MFDVVDGVSAGDAFMVAIHTGAATYATEDPMPSGPVLAD